MKIFSMQDMKGGWFVGDFDPSAYRTPDFEVCYKLHPKGEEWPTHYHKVATEVNYIIRGKMTINGTVLTSGDIFVIDPYEVVTPEFLEDCELIVVKTVSLPTDKYEL